MFDILCVRLWNFKSYLGEHEFWFPEEAGLYYLTGRNEFNPALGPNGTGKTSFIDAIFWCFYGISTRGLRASEVIYWGEGSCTVEVDVTIEDKTYTIARGQAPNFLKLDGKVVDQDQINKLLRMDSDAFQYAIILPQFGDSFFDLQPGAKLTLFSSIMRLDYWLERSKRAANKANRLEEKTRAEENELSRVKGRREEAISGLTELQEKSDHFFEERKRLLREVKAKLKKQKEHLDELREAMPGLRKLEKAAAAALDGLRESKGKAERDYFDEERDFAKAKGARDQAEAKAQALEADAAHFKGLKGSICPTCLQLVDDNHLKKQGDKVKEVLNGVLDELDRASAEVERSKKRRKGLQSRLEEYEEMMRHQRAKVNGATQARQDGEIQLQAAERDFRQSQNNLEELERAKDPYKDMIEKRERDIDAYEKEQEEIEDAINDLRAAYDLASFWVNGFKRIRLFVIEDALKQLEIEINNNLSSLGLHKWMIELDVERENKSGGITKGFTVLIHSPKHDKPIRYEAFSGGETQRIRLAGDLALATLILQRAGLVGSIEMHDEPSEHMSPEGLADLVDVLSDRADADEKKIWLVDHHTFDAGAFAGTATAVMSDEGSVLEYEEAAA